MRLLVLLLSFFTASAVMAGNFTLATVDMQKLFKAYPGTAPAQKRFVAYTEQKKQDLADSQQVLKDFQNELDTSKGVLSAKDRKEREDQFAQEAQNYQNEKNDVQQELSDKEADLTQSLVNQIKVIVAKVAQKDGVDLVLDSNDVVGAPGDLDLTAQVLKSFSEWKSNSDDSDADDSLND